jgi:MFS family permease
MTNIDSNSAHPTSSARLAWMVVALLSPVALLNYLDRQMLASMKFSVMTDLPDIGTEANWGWMLGLFKFTYAGLSPVGGYVADRISRKLTICISLFAWSLVTWWTGHVDSYRELIYARAAMGVSEAFYIPAALALITDFHPGATRSRAVGLHQLGIYCGVILGGFTGYLADFPTLGWRWAFYACGIAGLLYSIPLLWKLQEPPVLKSASIDRPGPIRAGRELLGNPSFILLVFYFTLPALAAWIIRDWMPAILKTEFGIGQGKAGVSATLFWQSAAIGGAVLGGWMADRWSRRTPRGRIYVSAIGTALIVPAMFGVGMAPRTGLLSIAIIFLIIFGLGWGFFDCNNMPILCQVARPELRATGYGFMNLVSISAGGLADWAFGSLRDHHVPLPVIFGIFSTAAVLGIALVLMIRPREFVSSRSA